MKMIGFLSMQRYRSVLLPDHWNKNRILLYLAQIPLWVYVCFHSGVLLVSPLAVMGELQFLQACQGAPKSLYVKR